MSFAILMALVLAGVPAVARAEGAPESLRVMTFNILHSSLRNVVGPWDVRRARVVATIHEAAPDVACLQEVSDRQLVDLAQDLPEYAIVEGATSGASVAPHWWLAAAGFMGATWLLLGASRARSRLRSALRIATASGALLCVGGLVGLRYVQGDFLEKGEHCPILLRRDRIAVERQGTFWDSDRPDRAGSMHAGGLRPHIVTWADVTERGTGARYTLYNAHLPMMPWIYHPSATTLLTRMDRDRRGWPQILAGDLNAKPGGTLLRELTTGPDPSAFRDAWVEAARRAGPDDTFHWGAGRTGPRIDYVLTRPGMRVIYAATVTPSRPPFPSDHHPLLVALAAEQGPRASLSR